MHDLNSENRHVCIVPLAQIGFAADTCQVQALDFGSMAARSRTWLVAVHAGNMGISPNVSQAVARNTVKFVEGLKLKPSPFSLESFVLPHDDAYVQAELQRLLSSHRLECNDPNWPQQLSALLLKDNVVWSELDTHIPPEQMASPWFPILLEREEKNFGLHIVKAAEWLLLRCRPAIAHRKPSK